jgi:hypothetical protein
VRKFHRLGDENTSSHRVVRDGVDGGDEVVAGLDLDAAVAAGSAD